MAQPTTSYPTIDPDSLPYTRSELDADKVLGEVTATVSDLIIWTEGPGASDIAALDESLVLSLKISFNDSPLSALLMCLGTDLAVTFYFEGFGEVKDVKLSPIKRTTMPKEFEYVMETPLGITARSSGLVEGLYKVAATVAIGPVTHECGKRINGNAFIGELPFQVY